MQESDKLSLDARLDRRRLLQAVLVCGCAYADGSRAQTGDFQQFLQGLWPAAEAAGVGRETFDAAVLDLTPDPAVAARPAAQSEFTVSIPAYVSGVTTSARIARGRAVAGEYSHILSEIERRSGVPGELIVAILGVESNFGTATGGADVLRVLATLAYKGHMTQKLSDEFVAALVMLQQGAPRRRLRGSWAGAMGMPQFMPSAYLKYAVGFAGGAAPDIWTSQPDAFASIGSFLQKSGWNPALPWGLETRLPPDYDFAAYDMDFSQFRALGFTGAGGDALPQSGAASLYLPAGAKGPAFLITDNFEVIRQYNISDAYALSVALLGDRIAGREIPRTPWPKVTPLTTAECKAMQQALAERGFYHGPIDGKLGRVARNAVHAFQLSEGVHPADGLATKAVLDRLKGR
ncbi:lytic murein transglycosylase [Methylocystis heyeri]|uniref:Lytic murein transglycosylase n=1 Tax=Methylocystis heyeri TaxID=391905 RepID=A0A6B8KK28_9HYPH|nr:lytic murein transglycosylase [Methylocystis heyeri]QGM47305.1 lytic murein transglycosylase [Methylocystis heyeri]